MPEEQLDWSHLKHFLLLYDVTSRDVRKRTMNQCSAEHCGSAKGLRIFCRRKVAGAISSEPQQLRPTLVFSIT